MSLLLEKHILPSASTHLRTPATRRVRHNGAQRPVWTTTGTFLPFPTPISCAAEGPRRFSASLPKPPSQPPSQHQAGTSQRPQAAPARQPGSRAARQPTRQVASQAASRHQPAVDTRRRQPAPPSRHQPAPSGQRRAASQPAGQGGSQPPHNLIYNLIYNLIQQQGVGIKL